MHDGAGERAVGARQQRKVHIGQFRRPGAVRIDDDELRAALLRACTICLITLTWVDTGLPPQTTIRSDLAISRASAPRFAPTPASQPASVSATQIVEFCRDQRIACRSRCCPSRCTSPIVPA